MFQLFTCSHSIIINDIIIMFLLWKALSCLVALIGLTSIQAPGLKFLGYVICQIKLGFCYSCYYVLLEILINKLVMTVYHILIWKTLFCMIQPTSIQAQLNHICNIDISNQHHEKKHCHSFAMEITVLLLLD